MKMSEFLLRYYTFMHLLGRPRCEALEDFEKPKCHIQRGQELEPVLFAAEVKLSLQELGLNLLHPLLSLVSLVEKAAFDKHRNHGQASLEKLVARADGVQVGRFWHRAYRTAQDHQAKLKGLELQPLQLGGVDLVGKAVLVHHGIVVVHALILVGHEQNLVLSRRCKRCRH